MDEERVYNQSEINDFIENRRTQADLRAGNVLFKDIPAMILRLENDRETIKNISWEDLSIQEILVYVQKYVLICTKIRDFIYDIIHWLVLHMPAIQSGGQFKAEVQSQICGNLQSLARNPISSHDSFRLSIKNNIMGKDTKDTIKRSQEDNDSLIIINKLEISYHFHVFHSNMIETLEESLNYVLRNITDELLVSVRYALTSPETIMSDNKTSSRSSSSNTINNTHNQIGQGVYYG
jgi:hypothetical protein